MYRWSIDIVLKSGHVVKCEYDGPESNSGDAIMKLFGNKGNNEWISLFSHNHTHSTYVVVGEIASVDIYERKVRQE